MEKTFVLCILDGYGLRDEKENNAIELANKPNLDTLFKEYNMVKGIASGCDVGLPSGQMGNSEVGHLNIGAGRIVYQDLLRINNSIENGDFFNNTVLNNAIDNCKKHNSNLHIMGLLSDGGVHTYNTHIYAILKLAKMHSFNNVYIDCFTDGRDTPVDSGIKYIDELENEIKKIGVGRINSICGRYYAMDRDKNYDRVEKAYNMLTKNDGQKFSSAHEAMSYSYESKITDEFVKPSIIASVAIKDNDSIIFTNFRPDRARELTHAFCDDDFENFNREKLKDIYYVCMTEYDKTINNKHIAFDKENIKNHIGIVISNNNLNQIRIAETEKYAHVTFFFNGGEEEASKNEDRVLVPSPKEVATYDLKPEMSAFAVCDKVIEALDSKKYDFVVVNFANPDMVGHTGNLNATKEAIEVVDKCVGKISNKCIDDDYYLLIIADHGNAELMMDDNGNVVTSHTNNKVPFCLISKEKYKLKDNGRLCDIAPTILDVMNISKPNEMSGVSLLVK